MRPRQIRRTGSSSRTASGQAHGVGHRDGFVLGVEALQHDHQDVAIGPAGGDRDQLVALGMELHLVDGHGLLRMPLCSVGPS